MGKGAAKRRRAANAARANFGNLHKASLGKASVHTPLPAPPSEKDLSHDKQSASFRKMLMLKQSAFKPQHSKHSTGQHAAEHRIKEPPTVEPAEVGGEAEGSSAQARGADGPASTSQPEQAIRSSGLDMGPAGIAADLFKDPQTHKTLNKKREFLKQRALKRKRGALESKALDPLAGQHAPKTSFGDGPAAQPLQVHLKRKNQVAKPAGERCKAIYLKQLSQAQLAMAAVPAKMTPAGQTGLRQAAAHELLRQQAIDAYRAQRSGHSTGKKADLASLAKLSKGLS